MKALVVTIFLVGLNLLLALGIGRLSEHNAAAAPKASAKADAVPEKLITPARPKAPEPETEFAAIYSQNPRRFVENLRAIGCPEETIKDILVAEIGRRYGAQEQALRPTPGDHVPYGWSPKTVEGKLISRRHEAAAIAREKASALREALGYDVSVKMHQYAMTTSDETFQRWAQELPPDKRATAQQIHEGYWAEATNLRNRTRGFWLREDVEELERLKARRNESLQKLGGQQ